MRGTMTVRPLIYILFVTLLGGVSVCMAQGAYSSETAILLGAMCAVIVFVYAALAIFPLGDHYLFMITAMLGVIGVVMLLRLRTGHGQRQVIWFSVGAGLFLLTALIYKSIGFWNRLNALYIIFSVALFLATAIFGTESHGAKSWIGIGSFTFQPSELIKLVFILTLSGIYTNAPKNAEKSFYNKKYGRSLLSAMVTYLFLMFLVLQRDWGTAVLFFALYIAFEAIYCSNRLILILNFILAGGGGFLGYKLMNHIKVRVDVWLRPFEDAAGKGYQITQSLFAIGEGGFSGRGIGAGSPYFIPEVHNDFIFSAICEEMGILGGMAVIMLYFVLVYRAFKISLSTTNEFNKAVAMGIGVMLGVQTFIIIGGVIKLIPLTGITLPFISYGGSSMVATFLSLGVLQGISARGEEIADEI